MIFAKKSLGQNFLRSEKAIRQIVEAAQLSPRDIVLEIGPGEGVLTAALLDTGAAVIAIEKDDRLISILNEKFASYTENGHFQLIHGDALEMLAAGPFTDKKFKVVANIPYYITGALLPLILESNPKPSQAVLLVQKEVAERIIARDDKESILSMSVKAYGQPRIVGKVPAGAFVPAPTVDSAILSIEDISNDFFSQKPEITPLSFFKVLKAGFAHKRKLLRANLNEVGFKITAEDMEKIKVPALSRSEDLTLDDWRSIVLKIDTIS
jgi:16S rRNA (adenine1518-N6/adenine1519-N6)-dimethyltransferase